MKYTAIIFSFLLASSCYGDDLGINSVVIDNDVNNSASINLDTGVVKASSSGEVGIVQMGAEIDDLVINPCDFDCNLGSIQTSDSANAGSGSVNTVEGSLTVLQSINIGDIKINQSGLANEQAINHLNVN